MLSSHKPIVHELFLDLKMNTEHHNSVHIPSDHAASSWRRFFRRISFKTEIAEQATTLFGWSAVLSIALFLSISFFTEVPVADFIDPVVDTLTPIFVVFSVISIVGLLKNCFLFPRDGE